MELGMSTSDILKGDCPVNLSSKYSKEKRTRSKDQTNSVCKDPSNPNAIVMKANFRYVRQQYGRLYHLRYNLNGSEFKKYRIFTTDVEGRSIKIFIPESDVICRNVNNTVVYLQRVAIETNSKFSKLHFGISGS